MEFINIGRPIRKKRTHWWANNEVWDDELNEWRKSTDSIRLAIMLVGIDYLSNNSFIMKLIKAKEVHIWILGRRMRIK